MQWALCDMGITPGDGVDIRGMPRGLPALSVPDIPVTPDPHNQAKIA
jgi:hypothetical protein